ncbi:MAG TPA: hypothetical protein VFZ21_16010 [Gemmatimonadaceae bacterium]|jgi:hypothetical protein|nr:hypothetical protein [Gemmatimonadaceae bacterium]
MYATCLFCNKALGQNEAIERFPVGRRLAFDATKGRLWVVCPSCERWNLSPLEERWEAIEDADRLYRSTRLRAATDQIGLARLRDGTELIRIGEPLRPEFAAWRYGDQFGRRRRRNLLIAGAGVGAVGALVAGGAVAGLSVGGFGWLIINATRSVVKGNSQSVAARIRTSDDQILKVRLGHLSETIVDRGEGGPISIDVKHEKGRWRFEGGEALRVASILMPKVNRYGGTKQTIAEAVEALERRKGSEGYLESIAAIAPKVTQPSVWGHATQENGLFGLTRVQRLAFEMALHEEAERRALEGELAELERAWREAEEIAHIADNLLVPVGVRERIEQLRGGG